MMYKLSEVQASAVDSVLALYKVAFIGAMTKAVKGVGVGLMGKAPGAALGSFGASRAAGGTAMAALGQGARGFQQAGGLKHMGTLAAGGAALGGGAYVAGRGFGAGQQASQQPRMF